MAIPVNMDKWNQVATLVQGTKVLLTDGSTAEFVRLKQKKFIGIINEQSYDIPVNMFVEVTEEVTLKDKENASKNLKKDDWFYIDKNGKAVLYQFVRYEGASLIGLNPISKGLTRISPSLYAGKVE